MRKSLHQVAHNELSQQRGELELAHIRDISDLDRFIFAARATGWSFDSIAASVHLSADAVRVRVNKLQDGIFTPLGLKRDTWASGWWGAAHATCCLGLQQEPLTGAAFKENV